MNKNMKILYLIAVLVVIASEFIGVGMISNVNALQITHILADNVTYEITKNTVMIKHHLISDRDLNVTIKDYFPKGSVITPENIEHEYFVGEEWDVVSSSLGRLNKGEPKEIVVSVSLKNGNYSCLLGADEYVLRGEKHKLAPKNVELAIFDDEGGGNTKGYIFILSSISIIVLIILSFILVRKRR